MLSRDVTARMARTLQRAEGDIGEAVTVIVRAFATDAPVTQTATPLCTFSTYDEHLIAAQALIADDRQRVLREDREARIATEDVTWTPTLFCELVRSDTSHWRIMSISGGDWKPFWRFRVRKVV